MQLEQIGRKDIIEQVGKVDGKATTTDAAQSEQKIAKGKLRSISVNNPFYNKNDLKEKTMAEKMEEQLAQGTDASLLHNQMAVYAQTTSGKDYEKMQEEGFSPMHMEAHTIVTVTDRIKVAMAKGGADISRMGGISDAKLEAISPVGICAGKCRSSGGGGYACGRTDRNDQDAGDGWPAVLGGCLLYVKK